MQGAKILVVDDEPDFQETVVKRLIDRGFEAVGADDGYSCMDILGKKDMDIVILDVKMPGMDGLEVLKKIKLKWPLVEVIMLTGHASVESGIQGMELGAFDYVMKPYKLEDLIHKLEHAYERKKIQQEKISKAREDI